MTADLLPIEIETGPNPRHCVIWMHGLGADGNDFVPIVEELDLPRGRRSASCFRTRRCNRSRSTAAT